MKKLLRLMLVLALSVFGQAQASEGWQTDVAKGLEQAKKEKKGVLLQFTGSDWCPPCMLMHKKVFSKTEFLTKAAKDFVLVELDFPKKDKALADKNQPQWDKYKIEGVPTVILLNSEGKEYSRFFASEYPEVELFLEHLKKSLERKDLD